MSQLLHATQSASFTKRQGFRALALGSSKVRLGHSRPVYPVRTLAPARLRTQQLRCQASGLPQWNFSGENLQDFREAPFQITQYGEELRKNKNRVGQAANDASATWPEKALVIAMAMQETQHMMASERDALKVDLSANFSALNLNLDMLKQVGYTGNGNDLNIEANLPQAVDFLVKAIHKWGAKSTLDFQRGGATALKDGVSYGAGEYRKAIQTIYNQMVLNASLLEDDQRVEIIVPHVTDKDKSVGVSQE